VEEPAVAPGTSFRGCYFPEQAMYLRAFLFSRFICTITTAGLINRRLLTGRQWNGAGEINLLPMKSPNSSQRLRHALLLYPLP